MCVEYLQYYEVNFARYIRYERLYGPVCAIEEYQGATGIAEVIYAVICILFLEKIPI